MLSNLLPIRDPVLIFAIVMSITLIAPLLVEKLRIPGIIGLIVAGIIIGPHTTGLLARDQAIELLSTTGLLYIMFLSGLEIDLNQFKKNKNHSFIYGFFTFAIPFLFGFIFSFNLLKMSIPQSILFGSLFSSHTLLTYPIVSSAGISKNKSVVTTIGGTILSDSLAMLVLAIITGTSSGKSNILFWIKIIVLIIVLIIIVLLIVPKISSWFFKHFSSNNSYLDFIYCIVILFVSAFLSHLAGLEPIIGAFLAGIALNSMIPENSILMNRIKFVGNSLFIPFFLISVGMLVDLKLFIKDIKLILISIGMVLIIVTSKFLASYISGFILKYKKEESRLIFGLSVNQAAATLAAVLVGYKIGLFDDKIIAGTIMMIIASCFVGAWNTKQSVKILSLQNEEISKTDIYETERILIPITKSDISKELMNISFLIRDKKLNEPIYPMYLVFEGKEIEERVAMGEKILAPAVIQAVSANIPVVPVTRIDINLIDGINRAIKELRISTIIINWHDKKTIQNLFFGSNIDKLLTSTRQTLLLTNIVSPINICKRVIIILPPVIERQFGIRKSLEIILRLSNQISAKIHFIGINNTINSIKKYLSEKKINLTISFDILKDWKTVLNNLKKTIKNNQEDLIVLFSSRYGQITWHPFLYKLPNKINSMFQENNIISIYPETEIASDIETKFEQVEMPEIIKMIKSKNAHFNLSDNIKESIKFLISSEIQDQKHIEKISDELIKIALEEPIEISTGIVLLHSHFDIFEESKIFLAVNHNGFDFKNFNNTIFAIFIIIASDSQPPENHLYNLASLAKLVQNEKIINILKKSDSYEDVINSILT